MSSEYTTSVQGLEGLRLHGVQATARAPQPRPSQAVERNEVAATDGQNVPPIRKQDAEQLKRVESAVSQISDFVQNFQRDLQFSIDKDSDRLVVKVVDSETQEVIRQIPSEETLRIAENLDSAGSLIFREQA